MTLTINRANYLKLLETVRLIPKVIETEAEYEQHLAVAERLIAKKKESFCGRNYFTSSASEVN